MKIENTKTGPSKRDVAFALTSTQAQIAQAADRLTRAFDPAQRAELTEELESLKRSARGFRSALRSFEPEAEPKLRKARKPKPAQAATVIRRRNPSTALAEAWACQRSA